MFAGSVAPVSRPAFQIRGVYCEKKTGRWRACMAHQRLGTFDTADEAARAYDAATYRAIRRSPTLDFPESVRLPRDFLHRTPELAPSGKKSKASSDWAITFDRGWNAMKGKQAEGCEPDGVESILRHSRRTLVKPVDRSGTERRFESLMEADITTVVHVYVGGQRSGVHCCDECFLKLSQEEPVAPLVRCRYRGCAER